MITVKQKGHSTVYITLSEVEVTREPVLLKANIEIGIVVYKGKVEFAAAIEDSEFLFDHDILFTAGDSPIPDLLRAGGGGMIGDEIDNGDLYYLIRNAAHRAALCYPRPTHRGTSGK